MGGGDSWAVIPSEGAKRRSRGIAVVAAEELSIGTTAIPRLAALARNDNAASERERRSIGTAVIARPSFRAKARSAAVEESPSSRPNGSLSGRLRFLDSLRSLGMTMPRQGAERLSIGTPAIPRLAALARNDKLPRQGADSLLSGRPRFLNSLRSLGMTLTTARH